MAEEFPNEAFSHPVVKIEPTDEWPGHDDFSDVTKGEPDNNLHPEESESEICKTYSMDPNTFSTFVKQEIKDEPQDEQETCETKAGTSTVIAVKQEETSEPYAKNSDQTQKDIKPDCDSSTVGGTVCDKGSESVSESSDSVSLPDGLIIQKLKRDSSGRAKEGVWTTKLFPKGTVFGPYATTPSSSKTARKKMKVAKPARRNKSNASCCVPDCHTPGYVNDNGKAVTFHVMPKDPKLLKLWIVKIGRDIGPLFQVKTHTRICSRHFVESDFRKTYGGRRFLKPDSVPSVFNRNATGRWKERTTKNSSMPLIKMEAAKPARRNKSKASCCVPGCHTPGYVNDNGKAVTFHVMPKDPKLLKLWIVRIGRDLGSSFQVTSHTKICSRHFIGSDFRKTYGGRTFLKPDSVPSVFNQNATGQSKETKNGSINSITSQSSVSDSTGVSDLPPGECSVTSSVEPVVESNDGNSIDLLHARIAQLEKELEQVKSQSEIYRKERDHVRSILNTTMNKELERVKAQSEIYRKERDHVRSILNTTMNKRDMPKHKS